MDAKWIRNVKLKILKYRKKIFVALDKIPWDFPGGTADKNLPANAGSTCLISGLGRFLILQGNWARASQLPSLRVVNYWSLCALEPVLHNKRSHHNEKPEYSN